MEARIDFKAGNLSASSVSSEKDDDEISNLSEKFQVLNGAATYIQKIYKGYATRKMFDEIYEHYANREEGEEEEEDEEEEEQFYQMENVTPT